MAGQVVRPEEWTILRDMDAAYVSALNEEIADQRAREVSKK